MEALIEKCTGLDVHQGKIVACVLTGARNKRARQEIQTFGTTTKERIRLHDGLQEKECPHVAWKAQKYRGNWYGMCGKVYLTG